MARLGAPTPSSCRSPASRPASPWGDNDIYRPTDCAVINAQPRSTVSLSRVGRLCKLSPSIFPSGQAGLKRNHLVDEDEDEEDAESHFDLTDGSSTAGSDAPGTGRSASEGSSETAPLRNGSQAPKSRALLLLDDDSASPDSSSPPFKSSPVVRYPRLPDFGALGSDPKSAQRRKWLAKSIHCAVEDPRYSIGLQSHCLKVDAGKKVEGRPWSAGSTAALTSLARRPTCKTPRNQMSTVAQSDPAAGNRPRWRPPPTFSDSKPTSGDASAPKRAQLPPSSGKPRTHGDDTLLPPPPTPPKLLCSPSKRYRELPRTPIKSGRESFWDQATVDQWNEEYSPLKMSIPTLEPRTSQKTTQSDVSHESPSKHRRRQAELFQAVVNGRSQVAAEFAEQLDHALADGKLTDWTASSGGIQIVWCSLLKSTAGTCRSKWLNTDTKAAEVIIKLSDKVIRNDTDLRDTLAHEMCHAFNNLVDGVRKPPHGAGFRKWQQRAMAAFPQYSLGMGRCHSIEIEYKYQWQCEYVGCGHIYGRHSRTIDPIKSRCGKCKGRLIQILPKPRAAAKSTPANPYQDFQRAKWAELRERRPGITLAEGSKLISEQWKAKQRAEKDAARLADSDERPDPAPFGRQEPVAIALDGSSEFDGGKQGQVAVMDHDTVDQWDSRELQETCALRGDGGEQLLQAVADGLHRLQIGGC